MSDPRLLAGLDIGGSKVLAVAVDPHGDSGRPRVVEQVRLATFQGPEGVVDTALRALTALAGRLDAAGGRPGSRPADPAARFSGVGIGVPGLVDARRGAITHAVNLDVGTSGLALADRLQRRLHLPVVVENDVNAAALGTAHHLRRARTDRADGADFTDRTDRADFTDRADVTDRPDFTDLTDLEDVIDLAYLSIGTGLAAGIVLDGELRRGPHNATGEIGHIPVDRSGPVCGCGQRGCLEAVASGSAIAARWPVPAVGAGEDGASTAPGPAQALFDAAAAGDPKAVEIRDQVADYLAAAVRMLALTLDVDLVVLGGGVTEVGEPLRRAVAAALHRQAADSPFLRGLDLAARLALAPPGHPVAAVGAALLGRPGAHLTTPPATTEDIPA
jgi:glucokinase